MTRRQGVVDGAGRGSWVVLAVGGSRTMEFMWRFLTILTRDTRKSHTDMNIRDVILLQKCERVATFDPVTGFSARIFTLKVDGVDTKGGLLLSPLWRSWLGPTRRLPIVIS
ncbi:hypothetical protein JOB18_035630 [Solea senegalensis]|uniref:Uncharacterized protein n=1 Tax=Solea senegalensis TaxID=28829 RepID=A0AAV6RMN8_SOLSE|nr:hypothetical protein JOB18_035630 [Solea senegalensis]